MTFGELSQKWAKIEIIGYSHQYANCLKSAVNHLNSYFADKQIEEIKREDVKVFLLKKYDYNPNTKKRMSKKLLSDLLNTGSRIYEFAIENDYCTRNPFKGKRNILPRKAVSKTREPLSETQRNLVLRVEHRAKIAAIIMMFCGLRLGEVIALEWKDIDFKNKKMIINKSAEQVGTNRYEVTPHTKNGKDRYVPVPDIIIPYLKKEKKKAYSYLVFPKKNGELQTPSSYSTLWKSYQGELNYVYYSEFMKSQGRNPKSKYAPTEIPVLIDRFTAHQLRHTCCTLLYLSGVDVLTTSKILGHSSIELTLKIYTHLDERFKQFNISKFNDYINTIIHL